MITKVVWQTKAPVVFDSFQQQQLIGIAKGGNVYNYLAVCALAKEFSFSIDPNSVKRQNESLWQYLFKIYRSNPDAAVTIKESYPVALSHISRKTKNVALIHHIDTMASGQSLRHKWFFYRLIKNLRQMDLVITVSKYWELYLKNLGCTNVITIYNAFNPEEFICTENEILDFKKKYNFGEKPVIYIGNAHIQKGVYDSYNALKHLDVEMVMTGSKNEAPDLPVRFLSLSRKEYILLLTISDVVVLMSNLLEGWNRVAHEALLCKTPVIGSGAGGMKELLENAKQTITLPENLYDRYQFVSNNRQLFTESGYNYVKQFDYTYFNNAWKQAIKNLIEK
jgi:glycosyltransferase involved in cell wall biosynthesis